MLGQIRSAHSKSSGGDDGKTDRYTNDEQYQGIVKKILRSRFCDLDVMKETTDPGREDPEHDEN